MIVPSVKLRHLYYAIPVAMAISGVAWAGADSSVPYVIKNLCDTVPAKIYDKTDKDITNNKSGDIDQGIEQLDRAMEKLDKQLDGKQLEKMQQQIEESLSQVDLSKIQQSISEAMKKVDLEKMRLDAELAIKKVDWDKIQNDLQSAMEEAKDNKHVKEIQAELQKAMKEAKKSLDASKKVDMEKIREKLDESRIQWEKESRKIQKALNDAKEEMSENKQNLKQGLEEARQGISKAKEELVSYKNMISLMEKDGLLKSNEDYSIKYHSGELIINGQKQPKEVTDKYKTYLKDDVELTRENGKFSLKKGE
jgi:chromosome segregation ATPase